VLRFDTDTSLVLFDHCVREMDALLEEDPMVVEFVHLLSHVIGNDDLVLSHDNKLISEWLKLFLYERLLYT